MPNIAQQDYIIIDWGGKNSEDAARAAEVAAQLRKLAESNPLTLLSVIFKDYDSIDKRYEAITSIGPYSVAFYSLSLGYSVEFDFAE